MKKNSRSGEERTFLSFFVARLEEKKPQHRREGEKKKKQKVAPGENLTFALAASSFIHLLLDDIVGVRGDVHRSLLHAPWRERRSARVKRGVNEKGKRRTSGWLGEKEKEKKSNKEIWKHTDLNFIQGCPSVPRLLPRFVMADDIC